MSRRFLRPIIVVIGLFTPTVAQAAPPYDHMRYLGNDSFRNAICGLDVTIDVEYRGILTIRTVKDSGSQAFLAHDNHESVETITNPVSGHQLIIRTNDVFHEQHAKHVEGNAWLFEAVNAGTFTLTTPDGTRLLRDRGVIKFRAVFDTLGDGQPGGIQISEEVLSVHGPHADESTFCSTFLGQLT